MKVLFCLGILVLVVHAKKKTVEISDMVRQNFLSGGQRTEADLKKTAQMMRKLSKQTRRKLFSGKRTLAFNSDKPIPVQHAPEQPMNEESLNLNAGISDFLYQGDIAMTSNDLKEHLGGSRRKRSVIHTNSFPKTKWDPNHIPYYFDPSLPSLTRKRARETMDFYEEHTCLRFKEDGTSKPRLRIFYGTGCWSYIGKQPQWATQDVSYGKSCESLFGIMAHELMHALGFYHEQSRSDRDTYVDLNAQNIHPNNTGQFNKESSRTADNLGFSYEYGSVMHYAADVMAVNNQQPVLVSRNALHQNTMGQRIKPSFQDLKQINTFYECGKNCGVNKCQNKGYPNPNDCSKCLCPHGFGGDFCDQLEEPTKGNKGCGKILQATTKWQMFEGAVHSNATASNFLFRPEVCHWQIKAPAGKRISLSFKRINSHCVTGCVYSDLEVKTKNFDQVGYRICCKEDITEQFNSEGNIVVINANARLGTTSFKVDYIAY